MYRAVTLALLRKGVELSDAAGVQDVLDTLDLRLEEGGKVYLGQEEVSGLLRSQKVEKEVSPVSALPAVRACLKTLQRREALRGPLVAEGRDMGSVVFPDAKFKFFLDASPAERARRRHLDFEAQGRNIPRDQVLREIERRDYLDSTRKDAPLVRTPGMEVIDSTEMEISEIVDFMATRVKSGKATGQELGRRQ
jgi:cytidylate kinase